ncbi:hypothetical protein UVI_02026810 [Ustilaginoidea virens]|uniref:AN1-type domain-containing protein n=4 Tax=Clavicipitaceae TaxID=34397 RepID=A0A1B5L396_USTVR|nr:hypothetical protein UVI_02026810 [Ustilaginoidea virens]
MPPMPPCRQSVSQSVSQSFMAPPSRHPVPIKARRSSFQSATAPLTSNSTEQNHTHTHTRTHTHTYHQMAPKKIRCGAKECREPAQRIVGDCGFCNGHFCGKHRLLEDHKCSGLEDCKKQSHERNAAQLEAERTQVIRGV